MTFHLVTEIDDIDGSETVRFVTADGDLAAEAQSLLVHHGLRTEIRDFHADAMSLEDLEAEEAMIA